GDRRQSEQRLPVSGLCPVPIFQCRRTRLVRSYHPTATKTRQTAMLYLACVPVELHPDVPAGNELSYCSDLAAARKSRGAAQHSRWETSAYLVDEQLYV